MHLQPPDGRPEKRLRADAARNRALILETASKVFAEHGLDAGYDEIARRAGVGVGTVYRRFPERGELIQALFESIVAELVDLAAEASANPDPWEGLVWFIEQSLERQVANRGLKEVMFGAVSDDANMMLGRDRITPGVALLVERAQADGSLRRDIDATDVGLQAMLISAMTTEDQPELWRRYLAIVLEGMRARPGLEPLPLQPPPDEMVHELMRNLHGR